MPTFWVSTSRWAGYRSKAKLTAHDLKDLDEAIEDAFAAGATSLALEAGKLTAISPEALRYLAFLSERRGSGFKLTISGATGQPAEDILESEVVKVIG